MEAKYKKSYADRLKFLVIECGLINSRGQIAWSKIARALHISQETMRRWQNPMSKYYKEEFAQAVKDAQESVELGRIKRSMIDKAKGYTKKKVVKEVRIEGPMRPRKLGSYSKSALLRYAKKYLKKKIDSKLTRDEVLHEIDLTLAKLSKEVIKTSREETEKITGDVQAAKLVTSNIGSLEDRWYEKQQVGFDPKDKLEIEINVNEITDKHKSEQKAKAGV